LCRFQLLPELADFIFEPIQPVQESAAQHKDQQDNDAKKKDNDYFHMKKAARAG
jgi:hypothetical protein